MSKENPSRSKRPRAPPYVPVRSCTTTRWPATASRAAAAIAPIPAPITAIRAMPGTLSAATDSPARGPGTEAVRGGGAPAAGFRRTLGTTTHARVTGRRRTAVSRDTQG
ncbi:hypothetical protein GCM10010424_60570 [Streptomyces lienomycini]